MTEETIVAVFDKSAHADAAVQDLKAAGVPAGAITQHAKGGGASQGKATADAEPGFWASIFGSEPDGDAKAYDGSIQRGATVVAARVPTEQHDRVAAVLMKHGPIDLDERAAAYASAAPDPSGAPANGGTIRLAKESMTVGKRAVRGDTTRIRRYVVSTPVEKEVTLHQEKVMVDRHPVSNGQTVGKAAFTDKTIEMTATSEEAVVAKDARVTEEISLRKVASDRVETVTGTIRHSEVEIEKFPGGRGADVPVDSAAPASARGKAKD